MTDIVAELRRKYEWWALGSKGPQILLDAATEIDRLRAALKIVSEDCYLDEFQMEYRPTSAALTARAALSFTSGDGNSG